jgi:chorismate mutase/prephenate dehydratase
MAKEKTGKKGARANPRTSTIAGLRARIDRLDRQLVKLVNERAKIALEIGKLKNSSGVSAYAPAREDEVLGRVAALSKGPLTERCIRAVFRELISGSRS